MLAYALHVSLPINNYWLAFSFNELIGKIQTEKQKVIKSTYMETDYQKSQIAYFDAILAMLNRPQGFIPGYQYSLHRGVYECVLLTAYTKELPCCKEVTCEHNTILGVTCEIHGNFNFEVKCLQGQCKPQNYKLP